MPLFFRNQSPIPGVSPADIKALADRLDAVAAALEAHCVVTSVHGELIAHVPQALVDHLRAEIRGLAKETAAWAWIKAREQIASKAFAIVGGAVTAYGLWLVHGAMTWFSTHGK